MKPLDRESWRRREEGYAAYRVWEERARRERTPEDREREVELALEAFDLWWSFRTEAERRPRVDMEKVRGIQEMRARLARVRPAL
ncbi:MAG TPA: hypothetical protein VFI25_00575 [Planctomycetota bacterium]|nr:hypothetical protein [Planctomycetota bacterium]